jgi:signal transduction histidine kinase
MEASGIEKVLLHVDFKNIFENLPCAFLVMLPDVPHFTMVAISDALSESTATGRSEIEGRGLGEVFPRDAGESGEATIANLKASLAKVAREKKPDEMEIQRYDVPHESPDGIYYTEEYWQPINRPILNPAGEVIYLIHESRNVTKTFLLERERVREAQHAAAEIAKQSEHIRSNEIRVRKILDALQRYTTMDFSQQLEISGEGDEYEEIAKSINRLTSELESHIFQLGRSCSDLKNANDELDAFSYSVSHDLRAPLRAINGYALVLVEDFSEQLGEKGNRSLEVITRNAQKMSMLIEDLLSFSKIGKQQMQKVPMSMQETVKSVLAELPEGARSVEFNVGPLPDILGDKSLLRVVLENLVSNAVKYSSKKEKPVIEIGSYADGKNTVYYVRDNGAGFNMRYYDKLFGVFQRLHAERDFPGSGVGLALVQRIIRRHTGDIWAEAAVDAGATFYFSLPSSENTPGHAATL